MRDGRHGDDRRDRDQRDDRRSPGSATRRPPSGPRRTGRDRVRGPDPAGRLSAGPDARSGGRFRNAARSGPPPRRIRRSPGRAYALERLDPRWLARQRGQALAALHLAPDPFAAPSRAVEVPDPSTSQAPETSGVVAPAPETARPGGPPVRITPPLWWPPRGKPRHRRRPHLPGGRPGSRPGKACTGSPRSVPGRCCSRPAGVTVAIPVEAAGRAEGSRGAPRIHSGGCPIWRSTIEVAGPHRRRPGDDDRMRFGTGDLGVRPPSWRALGGTSVKDMNPEDAAHVFAMAMGAVPPGTGTRRSSHRNRRPGGSPRAVSRGHDRLPRPARRHPG